MSLLDTVGTFLSHVFTTTPEVTQGAILQTIKSKAPAYANTPDDQFARMVYRTAPDQFPFLKNFKPDAAVDPATVPPKYRTGDFYDKFPDLGKADALKAVKSVQAAKPELAGQDPLAVAQQLETINPARFKGISRFLEPPKPTLANEAAGVAEKVVSAADPEKVILEAAKPLTEPAAAVTKAVTPFAVDAVKSGAQSMAWMKTRAESAENKLVQSLLAPKGPMVQPWADAAALALTEMNGIYKGVTGDEIKFTPQTIEAFSNRKLAPEYAHLAGQTIGGLAVYAATGAAIGAARIGGAVAEALMPNMTAARYIAPAVGDAATFGAGDGIKEGIQQVRDGKFDPVKLGKIILYGGAKGGLLGATNGFTSGTLRVVGQTAVGAVAGLTDTEKDATPTQMAMNAGVSGAIYGLFGLATSKDMTLAQKEGAFKGARNIVRQTVERVATEAAVKSGYAERAPRIASGIADKAVSEFDSFIQDKGGSGKMEIKDMEKFASDFRSKVNDFIKPLETPPPTVPAHKTIIEKAGGEYLGPMGEGRDQIIAFNDPKTHSTLALPPAEITVENVAKRMQQSRDDFGVSKTVDDKPMPATPPIRESAGRGGVTLQSTVVPGAKEFIEQDVAPAVKAAGGAVAKVGDSIQKAFAPATRGREASVTAGIVRENAAELARKKEVAYKALDLAARTFDKLPKETNYDFIDKMESGQPQTVKELQPVADNLRKLLDERRAEIQSLGTGKLEHFIRDYFPHIWKDPVKAGNVFASVFGKRPLEGSKSFLKKRTIESFKEGIEKGLEPVTDNPIEMAMLKVHEMDRYLMGQRTFREMKERKIAQFVKFSEKAPDGYAKIDDKVAAVYGNPNIPIDEAFDKKVMEGLMSVARDLGISVERIAKIKKAKGGGGGDTWGYASTDGKIVTKFGGPESVLAHEIGHQLDFKYGLKDKLVNRSPFKEELAKLAALRHEGELVDKEFSDYVQKGEEKMAVMLESYIHAPEKLKKVAPNTYKFFDQFVKKVPQLKLLSKIKPSLVLASGESTVNAGGLVIHGQYYAPEPAAKIINNYLSPGLKGNVLYDALRGTGNFMNQVQLGLSAFHLTFTTIDSLVSSFAIGLKRLSAGQPLKALPHLGSGVDIVSQPFRNYIKGSKVLKEYFAPGSQGEETAKIVDALIAGGGRVKMDSFYKNSSVESFWKALKSGNYPGAAIRGVPAMIEAMAKPIMEVVVPRQKLGVFFDMAEFELEKLGPNATREQMREAMGKAWDSVDNRLGQLVYDNLFWNKALKDLGLGSVRSLGWNIGTIRELGGGAADAGAQVFRAAKGQKPEVTHRMAYLVALPLVAGIMGAMFQYLMTGHGPSELKDYYFPKTGRKRPDGTDERVSFPSYMKDIYAYGKDPLGTLGHKVHPIISTLIDMLKNEDYYGTKIRNEDDPLVQQMKEEMAYVSKQFLPFSIRNLQQRLDAGDSGAQAAESFFGITPAPGSIYKTPAQEKMQQYMIDKMPRVRTQADFEKSQQMKTIVEKLRGKVNVSPEVEQALKDGKISRYDVMEAHKRARQSAFAEGFKRLEAQEALKVYEVSSPEEKAKTKPYLIQKVMRDLFKLPPQQRMAMREQLKNALKGGGK